MNGDSDARTSNPSNDLPADLRYHAKHVTQGAHTMERAATEIERLTRERDHYKSEADNLRGLWNDPNHLALFEGRENAARGYAPKRTAPEHGECDDPEHVEAMRHLASIMDTEAERDRLRAALERIKRIGPLGVDTYPECCRRMHAIAVAALSGEPTSAVETPARPFVVYRSCAKHVGIPWTLSATYTAPPKEVRPICEPPSKASDPRTLPCGCQAVPIIHTCGMPPTGE